MRHIIVFIFIVSFFGCVGKSETRDTKSEIKNNHSTQNSSNSTNSESSTQKNSNDLTKGKLNEISTKNINNSDFKEVKLRPLSELKNYDSEWKEVFKDIGDGLPKSALEKTEKIYKDALKEDNIPQQIKALIHKFIYIQQVEEEGFVKIQEELQKLVKESPEPYKSILHTMIAEQYWNYYQQNRWRFLGRSETAEVKENDMRTWSLQKLVKEVWNQYHLSIENSELLTQIQSDYFKDIITIYQDTHKYRPTLYDFLAHRAIDFFMNHEAGLTQTADDFNLDKKEFFLPVEQFVNIDLTTKTEYSFQNATILIFQKTLQQQIKKENIAGLIDLDVKRLKFLYDKSTLPNKAELYEERLKSLLEKYPSNENSGEIAFHLAELYKLQGEGNPTGPYRWHLKKSLELCEKYSSSNRCAYLIEQLKLPYIYATTERFIPSNSSSLGELKYRNLDTVYYKIVKYDSKEFSSSYLYDEDLKKLIDKKSLKEGAIKLSKEEDLQIHSTEFKIDPLPSGVYVILLSKDTPEKMSISNSKLYYSIFNVSLIAFAEKSSYKNESKTFKLFNRVTGESLKGVKAQTWYQEWSSFRRKYVDSKGKSYKSNSDGEIEIRYNSKKNEDNYFRVEFTWEDEKLFLDNNYYLNRYYDYNNRNLNTIFFLDRKIYRPGQTVYYKGIALYQKDKELSKIAKDTSLIVSFYDVNHQVVSTQNVKTNSYGTFSGSFVIPTNLLNGQMYLYTGYGTVYFSVEEYKRPKFEVKFPALTKEYKLEDDVTIIGEAIALAGNPIDGADVKYRVVREVIYPYWDYYYYYYRARPQNSIMELTKGVSKTDSEGKFEIKFPAIPDKSIDKSNRPAFVYKVYADVTDINGETRSGTKAITIGYSSLLLKLSISDRVDKNSSKNSFKIDTTNLSGDPLPSKGKISIYEVENLTKQFLTRDWGVPDRVTLDKEIYEKEFPLFDFENISNPANRKIGKKLSEDSFDTSKNKQWEIKNLKTLKSGTYLIEMISGEESLKKYVTIFSTGDKTLVTPSVFEVFPIKAVAEPGEKAQFLVGTSDSSLNLYYEYFEKGVLKERNSINLKNEQKIIEFPITESSRGNTQVHFYAVRHNRQFSNLQHITVPWSNKKLNVVFETFRSKLQPGEKESWKLKITDNSNKPQKAEMLATLYDASLDLLRQNSWYLNPFPSYYPEELFNLAVTFGNIASTERGYYSIKYYNYRYYDTFNWFGFYWNEYYHNYRRTSKSSGKERMKKSKEVVSQSALGGAIADESSEDLDAVAEEKVMAEPSVADQRGEREAEKKEGKKDAEKDGRADNAPEKPKEVETEVKARTNFSETAFFYPHIESDENGVLSITFDIPESLTRWKMLGLATTESLDIGTVENELVTQKDLMVVPNMPRFLRENDSMIFTAKITNISDKELKGVSILSFLDASTLENVDKAFKNDKNRVEFTVPAKGSIVVSFPISIPDSVEATVCKIVAKTDNLSDGEEHVLPILKNRMLVTETMPLPVRAKQTKEFKFDKLINSKESTTLKHFKYTLEFTSNPVWYAIQALPYIIEYPYECVEQTFTRYYANTIASFIANSSPKIKQVFDSWKNLPNSNALLSNLEKNQELKSLLLEETPWVIDAKSETESKRRVALLFDLNRMGNEKTRALKKIMDHQLPSGGFPWFKGMRESQYITAHLVTGFAHLEMINVEKFSSNSDVKNMIHKAVQYLDREIRDEYNHLLKSKIDMENYTPSYFVIQYFYARSYYKDVSLHSDCEKAVKYFKKQIEKFWLGYNNYAKGMIAIAAFRDNNKELANHIVKSLKEHALYSEEMGMYWKESYGYYWYQLPIETHSLMIELFSEAGDQDSVSELKTWLLKSKQTQNWGTTKATADAVFALLLKGDDWLKESKLADITVAGKKLEPKSQELSPEAGTGYLKYSWSGSEVTPEMGVVTVTNNNNLVAWGGVYWQYFEQLDKITKADNTPLKLDKKLFVKRDEKLYPLDKVDLVVGDKVIVRVELRVDRDMEYVHMKDLRASSFEPINVLSGYRWQDGLGYYETTKDGSTNFFFDYLRKGTYVFEYPLFVTHKGEFSNGITTIQSMYAPEFSSHSEGVRVLVK
ncbi:hypothetical protein JXR93_02060 [bacterium]|nr:hypothetical protein [bacterium]